AASARSFWRTAASSRNGRPCSAGWPCERTIAALGPPASGRHPRRSPARRSCRTGPARTGRGPRRPSRGAPFPSAPRRRGAALAPAMPVAQALNNQSGTFGALAEAAVANRLGLQRGERFRIGDAELELRAVVERQHDAISGGLAFGPRIIVSQAALTTTGLI